MVIYDNIYLSSEEMFKFSDIVENQGQSECVTEKNVSDGKEMTENINDKSEAEFASDEDPLNMHRIELHQIRQLLFLRFQI